MNLFLLSILVLLYLPIAISAYPIENQTQIEGEKVIDPKIFFAIQHAQSGSISEINMTFILKLNVESNKTLLSSDTSKTFDLQLNNISDKTIILSDIPYRTVKTINTENFIGNWSIGQGSFEFTHQPNAFLIIDDKQKEDQGTFILELSNPHYDKNQKLVKYNIKLEKDITLNQLPNKFNKTTLIIKK